MTDKLRVDQSEITLGELADVEEMLGRSLSSAFEGGQARAIAALVWVIKRRTEPDYPFDEALKVKIGDLDVVVPGSSPEAPSGDNGQSPLESLASGT